MSDLDRVRDGLQEIDIAIHNLWDLGKNMVVGWTTDDDGLQVALAPCHRVLHQAVSNPRLLDGVRRMDSPTFAEACKVVQARVLRLPLPLKIGDARSRGEIDPNAIDSVIRRYSIMRTEHRAMALFDIVDFATASPVEQLARFMSLEHSISAAAAAMGAADLPVEIARSTAGDGVLYIWNRNTGLAADLRTYAVMILALTENAVAREAPDAVSGIIPDLRTAFTVGSHYSYHQVEANRPRTFEYATGQVTITLARMAGHALARQILVGNFVRPVDSTAATVDTVLFIARAERLFARLAGTEIDGHAMREIRSLVSGGSTGGAAQGIIKYDIEDKHGYRHEVFNLRAKASSASGSIDLGLLPENLTTFAGTPSRYELPVAAADGRHTADSVPG